MVNDGPKAPPTRAATPRAAIKALLLAARDAGAVASARDLATAARISERDVAQHLEHLSRSLRGEGLRVDVVPAECLACGYVFRDRTRYTAPSACPKCRSERVSAPGFRASS